MIILTHFPYDVNDVIDQRQAQEDAWQQDAGHVPAYFTYLTTQGWEPEAAADWVDGCLDPPDVADDGQPVCENPPDVADDDMLVVIWSGMYAEAA